LTSKKRKTTVDEEISSDDDEDVTVENNAEEGLSSEEDIDESQHAKRYRLAKELLADLHREEKIGDDEEGEDVVGERLKLVCIGIIEILNGLFRMHKTRLVVYIVELLMELW
jgi:hypothetical protein